MKKKLITLQEDIKDCGAASLSSIIKYYNGYIPMEKLREMTKTDQNGTTAYDLLSAASKYNLQGKGLKYSYKEDILNTKNLPVIAHLQLSNSTHFVVIYKINSDKTLLIMDPASGYQKVDFKEFVQNWTGVILEFYSQGEIPKMKLSKSVFNYLLKILLTEKKLIIKIIVISILWILLSLMYSFYFKIILEDLLSLTILKYTIIFLMIIIFKTIIDYIKNSLLIKLNINIDTKVIGEFLKHIILLPLGYIKSKTSGEIINRIDELKNIKNLFVSLFIFLFLDLLVAFIASIFLCQINYKLCLILFFILVIYLFSTVLFSKKIKTKIKDTINEEDAFNSVLLSNLNALESIKNLHIESSIIYKLNNNLNLCLQKEKCFHQIINKNNLVKNLIMEIGLLLINILGIYYSINNQMSLIDLITFNYLYLYLINPFKNLIDTIPEIKYVKESYYKISEFLDIKEEVFANSKKIVFKKLKLKNIFYSYNHIINIFNNLSLTIKQGEHIFLKGESGSGKSTLCKLIYRIYKLNRGEIFLNNKNIYNYDLEVLRNNITYLSQNENLFMGTIKDNIICERNINTEKYLQIIKICCLEKFINRLPLKDQTYYLDSSLSLSGGEKQRIILARSLLKNSSLIILDEALSEVDEKLEAEIIKNILRYYDEKIIIYVSHRNQERYFTKTINLKERNGLC